MLTPQEREAAYRQAEDFTEQCAAYRALLTTHELPLTVDMTPVERIYRLRLFDGLFAADPGLQARYALARTIEAQRELRQQTVDGLDLRGHELLDEVRAAQAALHRAYNALVMPNAVKRLNLEVLASAYGLDYGRLLDHYTMQWAGKEAAQAYFEQLGQVLTGWRNLLKGYGQAVGSLNEVLSQLAYFFPSHVHDGQPIVVDEQKLYSQLNYHPELLDVLAGLPAVPAELLDTDWPDEEDDDLAQAA